MNGSLSFHRGITKQVELVDGIHIRLQITGRGSARLYFVSHDLRAFPFVTLHINMKLLT